LVAKPVVVALCLLLLAATAAASSPHTVDPTSRAVTRFDPLNFKAAAAYEKAHPSKKHEEIEEIDAPQPPPPGRRGVPILVDAQSKASTDAASSFGTGISPPPAKTFKAEFLSATTIPPDTMGAVGTTHIITVSNDHMRILSRDGVEISRLTLTSFWAGVTIKGAAVSAFDPKAFYDRFNNRFILISSGNGTSVNSGAVFAVSATADPTGVWYRWSVVADPTSTSFPGGSGNWIDYPSVGHNKNWIVINENVFHYTCGATSCANASFWGEQIYVLDKQAAYSNTLGTINLFASDFGNTCLNSATPESELGCGFTMAPAITEDDTTDTEYLVEDWDSTAGQLRLSKITGTPSAPSLTVGTQFPQSANSWRFDAARIGTANNCGGTCSGGYMPQRQQSANLPSGSRIAANDSRIQNSVLRNGKLWAAHTVMLSASAQAAGTTIGGTGNPADNHSGIQWWQIDPTNETAASTPPLQRGRLEDATANNCHNGNGGTTAVAPCNGTTSAQFGEFFAFPNISVNQNEDVFIGFSRFSPLTYPNSGYVIRKSSDAPNTVRDPVIFRPGQSNYNIGAGSGTSRNDRWGDYSESQTDPLDDTKFWTVQEYAGTNRNDFLAPSYAGPWETWWAQVDPATASPVAGNIIISEFRLRGPQGVRDEFVELYNPTTSPVIVQTTDNSDGWALVFSTNGTSVSQVFAVVPNGTVIPAHGHFLVVDNPDNTAGGTSALTYSLNGAPGTPVRGADSDFGWSLDLADNGGIALFNTATTANFAAGTRLDSVGFATIAAGLFKEGNGIPAVTAATPTGQITFARKLAAGVSQDTDVNENDFLFLDPVQGETLGSTPKLGAAGPENLGSPLNQSGAVTFPVALLDSGVGVSNAPNRERSGTAVTNGAFGTLTLRREFTNNTGADLQKLRFRIVDLSTFPAGPGIADLRGITSADTSVPVSGGGSVNVSGTTVETPPAQANGGGINATFAVPDVTIASPLAVGASINVQFVFGVQATGAFNVCVFAEGDPTLASQVLCVAGNSENTPPTITPTSLAASAGTQYTQVTIANVSDGQDAAGSMSVTATSVPSGITINNITNTGDMITADVLADCALTSGAYNVTLQVTDSEGATATGTFVVNVTATPVPSVATITADTNGTGTTDQSCPEQPLTLHANGATGAVSYQWYLDNGTLNGENASTYQAMGAATYYVTATNACGTSAQSAGYVVQNPTPHSAFLSAGGSLICSGGSVQLSSDSATGIQWYKDGFAIPGANAQQYVSTAAGTYTAILDALGCHSSVSNSIVLAGSANPAPDATVTAPATVLVNSANNAASVPDAGAGATYGWSAFAGTITSGGGTRSATFKLVSTGTHAVSATVTTPDSCTSYGSANVNSVSSMTATHFSVSAPSTTTYGAPFNVTVTALDATNSPVTNYGGTIHFTSSASGTLPADYTFAGATDNGTHSFSATLTTNGLQTISVSDGTNNGSANTTVLSPTLTVLGSSQNPSVPGQSVTFTATVTSNPGPLTPTGTVTFLDGVAQLGVPVTLNGSGQAVLTTSSLSAGPHSISANYASDNASTFQNSVSNTVTQSVNVFVSGSITGLTGSGLVLRLTYGTGNTILDMPASGSSFTFNSANTVPGDAYAVSVVTQPTNPSQTCVVSNASGSIGPTGTNTVVVSCSTASYQVGVNVSGLSGAGLKVQLNGDSTLSVPSNGTTYFTAKLASGSDYIVSISTQPTGQLCSVTSPAGTMSTADVVVPVTCVTSAANLVLSVDDSHLYARYGQVLDYLVTLSNSGNAAATAVSVSSTASAGLDAANANWTCLGAGGGATCAANGSGAFTDVATLPPNRTLTWLVSVPVFGNTTDPDVTLTISAPGATDVSDVDTLVIFRDGYDVPYADGTSALKPTPDNAGVLGGSSNQVFTLPPSRGNAIEDVLMLNSGASQVRVQSVTLGETTLVRVLTQANGQERVSTWARTQIGAALSVGSVSADGKRVILLEGAEKSLTAPLTDPAR